MRMSELARLTATSVSRLSHAVALDLEEVAQLRALATKVLARLPD